MRISHVLAVCLLFSAPALISAADSAPPSTTAPSASTQAKQILDDMDADGPDGSKHDPGFRIIDLLNQEFSSAEPADVQQAVADLHRYEALVDAQTPRRGTTPDARAHWYCSITDRLCSPIIKAKQYDLVEELVNKGLLAGQDNSESIDMVQRCRVSALLAAGKWDQALPAAKVYYNVCRLANTPKAIDLVTQALLNDRVKDDPTIIRRFKAQQLAGAQAPDPANATPDPAANQQDNVLKSIKVDPAPYETSIKQLTDGPKDFTSLTTLGNLLLLADRPAEAKTQFELTVDIASDNNQLSAAVENVARAIRAVDGSVAGANAYIVSLRQPKL